MQIKITTPTATGIKKLVDGIPEFDPTPIEEIENRIAGKHVFLFTASENSEFYGFIVAYEDSPKVFYNWLTGVFPDYRGKLSASKLFDAIEEYAKKNGYKTCRVKTMNKFGAMLNLLSNRSYRVVGKTGEKIIFEKNVGDLV